MVPLKASLLFQLDLNRNILERVQALWEKEKKVTICVIVVWGGFFSHIANRICKFACFNLPLTLH